MGMEAARMETTTSNNKKPKLPPKQKSTIIELNIKHLAMVFFGVLSGVTIMGVTIILVNDYTKQKRQNALIQGVLKLVETFTPERREHGT